MPKAPDDVLLHLGVYSYLDQGTILSLVATSGWALTTEVFSYTAHPLYDFYMRFARFYCRFKPTIICVLCTLLTEQKSQNEYVDDYNKCCEDRQEFEGVPYPKVHVSS